VCCSVRQRRATNISRHYLHIRKLHSFTTDRHRHKQREKQTNIDTSTHFIQSHNKNIHKADVYFSGVSHLYIILFMCLFAYNSKMTESIASKFSGWFQGTPGWLVTMPKIWRVLVGSRTTGTFHFSRHWPTRRVPSRSSISHEWT